MCHLINNKKKTEWKKNQYTNKKYKRKGNKTKYRLYQSINKNHDEKL